MVGSGSAACRACSTSSASRMESIKIWLSGGQYCYCHPLIIAMELVYIFSGSELVREQPLASRIFLARKLSPSLLMRG